MELNLPILDLLEDSETILIAGAGGGFDVYAGLPIFFTLKEMGKNVHLANYSFSDATLAAMFTDIQEEIPDILVACKGEMKRDMYYYTEGYLTDWLSKETDVDPTVWMFPNLGVGQLKQAYQRLHEILQFDTLILVDGGVDSLARGDEQGPGSMLEDSITLVATADLDIPRKILACIGFGTEVEEHLDHYAALENISGIAKDGGFYGSCSLTKDMPVFDKYEAACRHAWDGENRSKSHISTRIIPAVHGEFGNYHMYDDKESHRRTRVFISALMSVYWFFDANVVTARNLTFDAIKNTLTKDDSRRALLTWLTMQKDKRPRKQIPY